jgi:hypothetical protein
MVYRKSLEIADAHYEHTKDVLIHNGSTVKEQRHGSRRILYANQEICGFSEMNNYIPLSDGISPKQFNSFLGAFTKSLYNQIRKNNHLLELSIEFDGISRDKNYENWNKIKPKQLFYNIDLSSAYWQMAYKLNYISNKLYQNYIYKDEYKEAKRYCVSFLARENKMIYFDNRDINIVYCDTSVLEQVYSNIRNYLYNTIDELKKSTDNWIDYNIDGISVASCDLLSICSILDKMNLLYKVNECIKIDKKDYYQKGKIRKFLK